MRHTSLTLLLATMAALPAAAQTMTMGAGAPSNLSPEREATETAGPRSACRWPEPGSRPDRVPLHVHRTSEPHRR